MNILYINILYIGRQRFFKFLSLKLKIYLNPTAACQTKANNKKNTGITGNTSTIGLKTT
jgi:hypothetical protein